MAAPKTLFIRLRQPGSPTSSLFLADVDVGEGGRRRGGDGSGFPREGPVYVPATGYVDLLFTDSVVLSYEAGCIRGFVNEGRLTTELLLGTDLYEALEKKLLGWGDYNDSGNIQNIDADTWTQVTNDALGPLTNETFLPPGASHFWDSGTNKIDLSDLEVGDLVNVRLDITITTEMDNARLEVQLRFTDPVFTLPLGAQRLDDGAGTYQRIFQFAFYIGSAPIVTAGALVEVRCSSGASLVCNGVLVQHL